MDIKELFQALKQKADEAQVDPTISGTVLLDLTGSDPVKWHGRVENGRVYLEDCALSGADMTVTASTDTALGLFQKKINPMMAFMTGKIKLSGDMAKISLLKSLILKKK